MRKINALQPPTEASFVSGDFSFIIILFIKNGDNNRVGIDSVVVIRYRLPCGYFWYPFSQHLLVLATF